MYTYYDLDLVMMRGMSTNYDMELLMMTGMSTQALAATIESGVGTICFSVAQTLMPVALQYVLVNGHLGEIILEVYLHTAKYWISIMIQ